MGAAAEVTLTPGSVFRTAALRRWGENPTRLAQRLEREGRVQRLDHGFLYVPRETKFGTAPPSDEALLDAFLDGTPYLVTGPARWNALGLGSTALHVHPLVYNTKRTGTFTLAARTFELRRVAFPRDVTAEWFVIDLLRHADSVGLDPDDLSRRLVAALKRGRFDRHRLFDVVDQFGTRSDRDFVRQVVREASACSVAELPLERVQPPLHVPDEQLDLAIDVVPLCQLRGRDEASGHDLQLLRGVGQPRVLDAPDEPLDPCKQLRVHALLQPERDLLPR